MQGEGFRAGEFWCQASGRLGGGDGESRWRNDRTPNSASLPLLVAVTSIFLRAFSGRGEARKIGARLSQPPSVEWREQHPGLGLFVSVKGRIVLILAVALVTGT